MIIVSHNLSGSNSLQVFPRSLESRADYFLNATSSVATMTMSHGTTTLSAPGSVGFTNLVVEDMTGELLDVAGTSKHVNVSLSKKNFQPIDAQWKVPFSELSLKERIGVGSYGEIYRAMYHGTPVAVKRLLNQNPKLLYTLMNEFHIVKYVCGSLLTMSLSFITDTYDILML